MLKGYLSMKWFKWLLVVSVTMCIAFCTLFYYFYNFLNTPVNLSEPLVVEIKSGQTLGMITRKLHSKGVLKYPFALNLYARLNQSAHLIKVGEFKLESGLTPLDWLDKFQSADNIQYSITFIEGMRVQDYMALVTKEVRLKQDLPDLAELRQMFDLPNENIEGFIYPDTYYFTKGYSAKALIGHAIKRTQKALESQWQKAPEGLPYQNPYEALIMASIIERETSVASERQRIAAVFVNRLNKKMKLQTDPTVIYGMGDAYEGRIRSKDLREATPYNTYVIKGLPPTPIANPTEASIHAALNPLQTDELFFVAKGDGSHYFSKTYEAHSKAVKEYQLNRKKDYKSYPGAK